MADTAHPTADKAEQDPRIVAIDIGSNSVRLVVAQVLPGGDYRVLDEERENTRLAAVLSSTGWLDAVAMDETFAALRNFLKIAEGYGADEIRAIATSAVRDAINGRAFCDRIEQELNLNVDVISASEEARLAFLSVARAFDVGDREVAVADIGGGSTEIVLASSGQVEQVYATQLGAVRIAEKCQVTDICNEKDLARLNREIDRELKQKVGKPPFVPSMLFGTGGTFTAMASILLARAGQGEDPMRGFRATRAEIRHLLGDLAHMSLEKRRKVTGLNPKRADIIVAGLAIIERILRHFRLNVVQVHTRGVRDGLLLTMIEQTPSRSVSIDERRAAVERFAATCGVDLPHANQVARIATSLWNQLAEPLGLRPEDGALLDAAALVANVGYLINFDKHHKHSYQLILNSELPGFERHDVQLLANVARYHRGSPPKQKHEHFRELSGEDQQRVSQLAAILRLALALDRTHQQKIDTITAGAERDMVIVTVQADEDPEVDLWAARRKASLFEKVFGREVVFSFCGASSEGASAARSSASPGGKVPTGKVPTSKGTNGDAATGDSQAAAPRPKPARQR